MKLSDILLNESVDVKALAHDIDKVLASHDEDLNYKVFAQAVATILKDQYGSHTFEDFNTELQKNLHTSSQKVDESFEYSSSTRTAQVRGQEPKTKTYISKFQGKTSDFNELLNIVDKIPDTVQSIKLPDNTTLQPEGDWRSELKKRLSDINTEDVTSYSIDSYYGVSDRENTHPIYIKFNTKSSQSLAKAMKRGDYGSLD